MGDRRNIIIMGKEGGQAIYFYSHWGGHSLAFSLSGSLKSSKDRWGDSTYLNCIIFGDMMQDCLPSQSGVHISLDLIDTDYPNRDLCVYHKEQTVHINGRAWTFQEFSELSDEDLESL